MSDQVLWQLHEALELSCDNYNSFGLNYNYTKILYLVVNTTNVVNLIIIVIKVVGLQV